MNRAFSGILLHHRRRKPHSRDSLPYLHRASFPLHSRNSRFAGLPLRRLHASCAGLLALDNSVCKCLSERLHPMRQTIGFLIRYQNEPS